MEAKEHTGPHSEAGIRVEERMRPAVLALNVWASCQFHQMNGGDGWPTFEECLLYFEEPGPPDSKVLVDSGRFYDETRDKFLQRAGLPPTDRRTLSCVEVVERVVKETEAPAALVRFLLFVHPEHGRFCPHRPSHPGGLEGVYRTFVDLGLAREFQGTMFGDRTARCAAGLLRALHGSFMAEMRGACGRIPVEWPDDRGLLAEPRFVRDALPGYGMAG